MSTNVKWPLCVALKGWSVTVGHRLVPQKGGEKWSRKKTGKKKAHGWSGRQIYIT